jgi:hypothetical protein
MDRLMFSINQGKGFSLKFENGYMLSVQFGPGNYCEHHMRLSHESYVEPMGMSRWESKDAEIAIIGPNDEMIYLSDYYPVEGWCSPNLVARVMVIVSLINNINRDFHIEKIREIIEEKEK